MATAVTQRQAGTVRVVHVNAAAQCLGLRVGVTLAEAKALLPSLVTLEEDAEGDRRALESLAVWAQRFSPVVHIEDAQTLLIDVSGCQRLFSGDGNILQQAVEGARQQGFDVRAAIADTAGAAWAIAHAHMESAIVVEPGQTPAGLARLPVHALRVDDRTVSLLASVGVETIEALLHLPRASLATRFDSQLLHRLDQALGDAPEPLVAYEPQRAVHVRMQFAPTHRREVLQEAVRRTLAVLCDKLARNVKGIRQIFMTIDFRFQISDFRLERQQAGTRILSRPNQQAGTRILSRPNRPEESLSSNDCWQTRSREGIPARVGARKDSRTSDEVGARKDSRTSDEVGARRDSRTSDRKSTIELALSRASRSYRHWEKLLLARLETVELPGPAHAVSVWATHVEPLDDEQDELFETDRQDARQLADLIDGLTTRLGPQAVAQAQPVSDHQPEKAYRYCRLPISDCRLKSVPQDQSETLDTIRLRQGQVGNRQSAMAWRPLRLLPDPRPIAVTALVPDGPPVQFRCDGRQHVVAACEGPERIETGWWRGPYVQRDYYRITDQAGLRLWIFRQRDDGEWRLHGWFD